MNPTAYQIIFFFLLLQLVRIFLNMSIYNELNPEFPIKGFLRIRPSIFDTPKKYFQKTENIFDVWYMSIILFWTTFPLSLMGKIKSIFVLLISVASVLIIIFLLNKKD